VGISSLLERLGALWHRLVQPPEAREIEAGGAALATRDLPEPPEAPTGEHEQALRAINRRLNRIEEQGRALDDLARFYAPDPEQEREQKERPT
jgi:hypothetical protein